MVISSLKSLSSSRSFRTTFIYYCGTFFLSFTNYLFHLILIRILVPSAYGEFLTLISFLYIIAIPTNTVSIVVTKYISDFYGKGDSNSINRFFYFSLSKIILPALVISGTVILFASPLAVLLKAHPLAFIILGVSLVSSFIGSLLRSYLISFHQFNFSIFLGVLEISVRMLVTVILVKLGLGATGAVTAMLFSGLIIHAITLLRLRPSILPRLTGDFHRHISFSKLMVFSLIYSVGTLSLLSTDVLTVRIFFDTHTSGLYSGLSMLGRIIYFGMTPLTGLMLPLVASRHSAGTATKRVFHRLSFATFGLGLVGLLIFITFPGLIVSKMAGTAYLEVTPLLPFYALTMFIFALSYQIITYCVAIGKNYPNIILLIITLAQPIILTLFHPSLHFIVFTNLILQVTLFLILFSYYKIALKAVL